MGALVELFVLGCTNLRERGRGVKVCGMWRGRGGAGASIRLGMADGVHVLFILAM
jgi:hypothetical protein